MHRETGLMREIVCVCVCSRGVSVYVCVCGCLGGCERAKADEMHRENGLRMRECVCARESRKSLSIYTRVCVCVRACVCVWLCVHGIKSINVSYIYCERRICTYVCLFVCMMEKCVR